ncbi:tyrosyl-DNA phosphodiesterase 1 [Lophiotrema nucula]|uniref:Tyrosyl-DNA phosphodiesterase 1 n=1 Tax=Lophiotrema nucula TaxID=690887 RepID=A0A6A5Z4W2_9PLEO|nr:tyrosyl-DNA phosphodiesterase 1 [Lophiotrema nucula]
MDGEELVDVPTSKRRKLDAQHNTITEPNTTTLATAKGVDRPISPPASRRKRSVTPSPSTARVKAATTATSKAGNQLKDESEDGRDFLTSPFQLTHIRDLSPAENEDSVMLEDILGDPMIKECWNFNFLFDLDFVMSKFDADVRSLVQVKIVHGFWKRDDERRIGMHEMAERYPNIELISAYMPDPFGTHHSKMLILLRHDDTAQIVIHTANMISRDWGNMTQAVWRSPLLLLKTDDYKTTLEQDSSPETFPIGSGERFEIDFLWYLNAYGKRLKDLSKVLCNYNFSAVRAAFIGSAPSRQKLANADPATHTSWGWLGLREILSTIPIARPAEAASTPHIVIQISSIATLGQTPAWLQHLQSVLRSSYTTSTSRAESTSPSKKANFFAKRPKATATKAPEPMFNIIFPTAEEIRTSLDGYASGGSIHTKIQSAAQQRQLQYLRPLLCHWRHPSSSSSTEEPRREAMRGPAAPHIKTFIRFSNSEHASIDWAMVTSANFSKQAWGDLENKNKEIWIQSWECGVVVWPQLFKQDSFGGQEGKAKEEEVLMVPVFGRDLPAEEDVAEGLKAHEVVGFRMPYDLPLSPYKTDETPWVATMNHEESDWKGVVWGGYQPHA